MSYEIIRLIQITPDAVYFRGDSNNVSPRNFDKREWPYFTQMLREQGREAVELSIFRGYEEGNLQPGRPNRFTKALDRLCKMPAYVPYDWRLRHGAAYGSDEYKAYDERRNSPAFTELLRSALYQTT